MALHLDRSSHGEPYYCELDHTALQVAPWERQDRAFQLQTYGSQMGNMDLNTCYNDLLRHYLPDDPTLQVVPCENPRSQPAPETSYSRSEKWAVLGDDNQNFAIPGASHSMTDSSKRNRLRKWHKIAIGLSGIVAISVAIIVVTIVEVHQSHRAPTPST